MVAAPYCAGGARIEVIAAAGGPDFAGVQVRVRSGPYSLGKSVSS